MAQIDGGSTATTKTRRRALEAADNRKAPRVSAFPITMARRPAGGDRAAEEGAGHGLRMPRRTHRRGPNVRIGPCLWNPLLIPLVFPCGPLLGSFKKDPREGRVAGKRVLLQNALKTAARLIKTARRLVRQISMQYEEGSGSGQAPHKRGRWWWDHKGS